MAGKFRQAVKELIEDQLAPFKNMAGPEQLTIINFINGSGEASSKRIGTVFVSSKLNLTPGTSVIGVPIGGRRYYVVGII